MTLWVYNNNNTGRRGVWHITDEVPEVTDYPEVTKEQQCAIFVKHKRTCAWFWSYAKRDCDCGVGNINHRGMYTEVQTRRAYTKEGPVDAICGQVTMHAGSSNRSYSYKSPDYTNIQPGDRVVVTLDGFGTQHYKYEGERPPGPTCIRCIRKVNAS